MPNDGFVLKFQQRQYLNRSLVRLNVAEADNGILGMISIQLWMCPSARRRAPWPGTEPSSRRSWQCYQKRCCIVYGRVAQTAHRGFEQALDSWSA